MVAAGEQGGRAVASEAAPTLARLPESGALAPIVRPPVLVDAEIVEHLDLGAAYWLVRLAAPEIASRVEPGQFVMLTVARPGRPEPVLPRPMAVYDQDPRGGTIDVVYRTVGDGTRRLSELARGDVITTVGPLGRGFVVPPAARRILVLGRGIGTCSLTALARRAAATGVGVAAIASARDPESLVGRQIYEAAGAEPLVEVVDSDGSSAVERLAPRLAAILDGGLDEIYTCGSARLLDLAVSLGGPVGAGVQVSLEAHMACGLGFCHGCASGHPGLADESPLVCTDGPVFRWTTGTNVA